MKATAIAICVGTLFIGMRAMTQVAAPLSAPSAQPPTPPSDTQDFMKTPQWLGQQHFGASEFAELEALVAGYLKSDTRGDDGRHALYLLTGELEAWFGLWDED